MPNPLTHTHNTFIELAVRILAIQWKFLFTFNHSSYFEKLISTSDITSEWWWLQNLLSEELIPTSNHNIIILQYRSQYCFTEILPGFALLHWYDSSLVLCVTDVSSWRNSEIIHIFVSGLLGWVVWWLWLCFQLPLIPSFNVIMVSKPRTYQNDSEFVVKNIDQ